MLKRIFDYMANNKILLGFLLLFSIAIHGSIGLIWIHIYRFTIMLSITYIIVKGKNRLFKNDKEVKKKSIIILSYVCTMPVLYFAFEIYSFYNMAVFLPLSSDIKPARVVVEEREYNLSEIKGNVYELSDYKLSIKLPSLLKVDYLNENIMVHVGVDDRFLIRDNSLYELDWEDIYLGKIDDKYLKGVFEGVNELEFMDRMYNATVYDFKLPQGRIENIETTMLLTAKAFTECPKYVVRSKDKVIYVVKDENLENPEYSRLSFELFMNNKHYTIFKLSGELQEEEFLSIIYSIKIID